jgi:hypothetical protein
LPNLMVKADLSSMRGHTPLQEMRNFFSDVDFASESNYSRYLDTWRRPGFQYRNMDPYFVVPERHRDIMSVGWNWKFRPERPTEISRIDIHSFMDVIRYNRDIPLIVDRLNMFFESDPLIMIRVRERPSVKGLITLVSRDKKLAHQVCRWVRSRRDRNARVDLVSPEFYILGRMGEFPSDVIIPDAGAINFLDRMASDTNLSMVHCNPPVRVPEYVYPGVTSVTLQGFQFPKRRSPTARSLLGNMAPEAIPDAAPEDLTHLGGFLEEDLPQYTP